MRIMTKGMLSFCMSIVLCFAVSVANAEPPSGRGGQGGPGGPGSGQMDPSKMMEMRASMLTDALKLDEKQKASVLSSMKKGHDKRIALESKITEDVKAIEAAIAKNDEAAMKPLVQKVLDERNQFMSIRVEEEREVLSIMTISQQAKYLVLDKPRGPQSGGQQQGGPQGGQQKPK